MPKSCWKNGPLLVICTRTRRINRLHWVHERSASLDAFCFKHTRMCCKVAPCAIICWWRYVLYVDVTTSFRSWERSLFQCNRTILLFYWFLQPLTCPNGDCETVMDNQCASKILSKSSKCPTCKSPWSLWNRIHSTSVRFKNYMLMFVLTIYQQANREII